MRFAGDERRVFLERFDPPRRSLVANLFLFAVRSGAADVGAVVEAVGTTLARRCAVAERYGDGAALDKAREVGAALAAHPDEAAAFASWALAWEALPHAERRAAKEQRAQQGIRRWMTTQPATDKQIAYLEALGHRGPVGDRRHASELIDSFHRSPGDVL